MPLSLDPIPTQQHSKWNILDSSTSAVTRGNWRAINVGALTISDHSLSPGESFRIVDAAGFDSNPLTIDFQGVAAGLGSAGYRALDASGVLNTYTWSGTPVGFIMDLSGGDYTFILGEDDYFYIEPDRTGGSSSLQEQPTQSADFAALPNSSTPVDVSGGPVIVTPPVDGSDFEVFDAADNLSPTNYIDVDFVSAGETFNGSTVFPAAVSRLQTAGGGARYTKTAIGYRVLH